MCYAIILVLHIAGVRENNRENTSNGVSDFYPDGHYHDGTGSEPSDRRSVQLGPLQPSRIHVHDTRRQWRMVRRHGLAVGRGPWRRSAMQ